ncbi:alpha/beta hydrolase fold domain-containing protein [Tsukamurella sp. 8F]|uniref:alpha/beta hydrolase n=1 Tax=unclassified Tsukamurella TaxID=2633480 RepID=UPI0023B9F6C1|nr:MULTISPECIES: alpha/beta hydrolase fold domain-containing protein [unclassified Tsukamurella]MDF0530277.1 alpha/beta hydrolase fold domain-containing protein [Tsukamurella sp. 8J]MDF0588595.1 alpha/beta hydrolase fold domain-containing protein [Tsukamurella sp. 8F]
MTDQLTRYEMRTATFGYTTVQETAAAGERWRARAAGIYSPPPGMSFAEYRDTVVVGDGADAGAVDETVAGVPVRVVRPERPRDGVVLHVHGGGWCLGSHRTQDGRLAAVAEATGRTVVSVGYRMAPESAWPAALADCVAVASAFDDLLIAGESAGAHLAVLTMLAVGPGRFRGALLTYGAFDLAAPAVARPVGIAFGGVDLRRYSPLFADLAGVPPACFVVGTRDPLLPDTLMMEARWRGFADTRLHVAAAADHAFTLEPIAVTHEAERLSRAFLRDMASNRGR